MSCFQLDPASLASRVPAGGQPPSLRASVIRGTLGFTIVSIAGFVPWAIFGRWLHDRIGEAGLYAVCAVVFIGLGGLLLHRLIMGRGSLGRFYKVFGLSFAAYSVAWIAGWFALRGHPGSLLGLLAGTAIMGWMLVRAFDAGGAGVLVRVVLALFLLNSAGYFLGGVVEGAVMGAKNLTLLGSPVPRRTQMRTAMLLWGLFYGLGFGAGIGYAFYACQARARELLRSRSLSASGAFDT